LSGKEFQKDGAATANARLARCLCVPGIGPVTRHRCSYHNVTWSRGRLSASGGVASLSHNIELYAPWLAYIIVSRRRQVSQGLSRQC